ncbi:RDD family protein [Geminisphaera colitermitum]|uniref:RDD family protein n=1 Tax=Geminisphaera colitermitum TaxID=1148786 RepID=UPI000158CE63|nr:RDD family protein [Geminisphaera colitermitum]
MSLLVTDEERETGERRAVWRVRTPEGAVFSYRLASPLLRLVALLVDWMTVMAVWSMAATAIKVLHIVSADLAMAVNVIGYFVLSLGYDMACEWRWRGQTLGKRLLRLRVVDAGGLRLTFPQIVLRNLLRVVDGLPIGYGVGAAAAWFSPRGQRLGDLAAGTLVVYEAAETAPDLQMLAALGGKFNSLREHPQVVARLRQVVTPPEARAAWRALAGRDQLEPAARLALFATLAAHFKSLTPIPPEAVDGMADEQFVRNVVDVLFITRGA